MELTLSQVAARIPAAVIAVQGDLDASNYMELIQKAQAAYAGGTRALVLDLSQTRFVSSSGLVAIHSAALILQGLTPPDPETGWAAIRAIGEGTGTDARAYLKLVNPQPRVDSTLEKVGFKDVLEIYPTVEDALASL